MMSPSSELDRQALPLPSNENITQASEFFERALVYDPFNVEALAAAGFVDFS